MLETKNMKTLSTFISSTFSGLNLSHLKRNGSNLSTIPHSLKTWLKFLEINNENMCDWLLKWETDSSPLILSYTNAWYECFISDKSLNIDLYESLYNCNLLKVHLHQTHKYKCTCTHTNNQWNCLLCRWSYTLSIL